MTKKRFQIALSFAGEHRDYVEQVAEYLANELGKENIFYDAWYEPELARYDLDVYLQEIYHDHSELIVPFFCADYEHKDWCGVEWHTIRDLLKKRQYQNIMFLRFDNAEIRGFFSNSGFLNLQKRTPEQTAEAILERLKLNNGTTAVKKN